MNQIDAFKDVVAVIVIAEIAIISSISDYPIDLIIDFLFADN